MKIAFIGYKGSGKDTLLTGLQKSGLEVDRFALGDVLKIKSYQGIPNEDYNYNFLLEDYLVVVNTMINGDNYELLQKIKNSGDGFNIPIFDIIEKNIEIDNLEESFHRMDDEEKLLMIETFKNVPELQTRLHLQVFGDYYKFTNNNKFIFSEYLLKVIKGNNIENYAITDTRFITEILDFLLDDTLIFHLYNNSILSNVDERIEHLSEQIALNINRGFVGYPINVEGTKTVVNNKGHAINFLDKENGEFDQVLDIIKNKVSNFNGYSDNFKDNIYRLKELYANDKEFEKLENDYIAGFKEYFQHKISIDKLDLLRQKYLDRLYTEYIDLIDKLLLIENMK